MCAGWGQRWFFWRGAKRLLMSQQLDPIHATLSTPLEPPAPNDTSHTPCRELKEANERVGRVLPSSQDALRVVVPAEGARELVLGGGEVGVCLCTVDDGLGRGVRLEEVCLCRASAASLSSSHSYAPAVRYASASAAREVYHSTPAPAGSPTGPFAPFCGWAAYTAASATRHAYASGASGSTESKGRRPPVASNTRFTGPSATRAAPAAKGRYSGGVENLASGLRRAMMSDGMGMEGVLLGVARRACACGGCQLEEDSEEAGPPRLGARPRWRNKPTAAQARPARCPWPRP